MSKKYNNRTFRKKQIGGEKKTYKNGDVYEGDLKNGAKDGEGKMTYKNGDVYEGEWKDDERHGNGKIIYGIGGQYNGDWFMDVRHGKGELIFNNGKAIYNGEWNDDKQNGKGKFKMSDGSTYEGDFKDGMMHGQGKKIYSNGCVYIGDYKNHTVEGKGVFSCPNGEVYEGDYKQGKRHGQGKMTYSNGEVYEGVWKDDKPYNIEFTISNAKYGECLKETAIEPIEGEVNVGKFIEEDKGNLVFKLKESFFGINKEQIRPIYENTNEIVYCCKKIGTIRRENIDIDNPFFNMNKIGIISGIVNRDYITKILGDTTNQLYEVVKTDQKCVATATGQMLGRLTGDMLMGADHCQARSDKAIYEIQIIKEETRTRKTFKKRSRKNNSKKSKSKSKKSKKRIFISSSLP